MSLITVIDINILSAIILLFVYIDAKLRVEKPANLQHKLYMHVVYVLAALLVADSVGRMFDGYQGTAYYWTNLIANIVLYVLVPLAPSMWVLYCSYQVYQDEKRLKKLIPIIVAILLVNGAFTLVSLQNGWYFSIDSANVYHRGPLFVVHMLLSFAIAVYPTVILLANRQYLDDKRFYSLLLFPVPTLIGGILQSLFYGTSLIWCCMTVSVMLIYLNIQAERIGTDYLTGVYNRRQLDAHVKERIQSTTPKKTFSAILIDLDNFKQINDTHGHNAGDKALNDTVDLLRSTFRRGDFISRYGGDEFLIILDLQDQEILQEAVQRLRDTFVHFNTSHDRPYMLAFTAGYAVYDMASGMDPEQFVKHIDKLMYEKKRQANVKD